MGSTGNNACANQRYSGQGVAYTLTSTTATLDPLPLNTPPLCAVYVDNSSVKICAVGEDSTIISRSQ